MEAQSADHGGAVCGNPARCADGVRCENRKAAVSKRRRDEELGTLQRSGGYGGPCICSRSRIATLLFWTERCEREAVKHMSRGRRCVEDS